jgi:putative hemolysin
MITLSLIVLAIAGSFFFSGIEMALISIRKTRLRAKKDTDAGATDILNILDEPHKMLTTILIGNNVTIIFGSILAENWMGRHYPVWGEGVAFVGMTLVYFIFAELLPKNFFRVSPEYLAIRLAPVIKWAFRIIAPAEWLVRHMVRRIQGRSLGAMRQEVSLTREEFLIMVETRAEEGVFSQTDRQLIHAIMDMKSTPVAKAMKPWSETWTLSEEATRDQLLHFAQTDRIAKIPILSKDQSEKVIGLVNVKDLLFADGENSQNWSRLVKPVVHLKESATLANASAVLGDKTFEMAVIYKEQQPVGIITLNSLHWYFQVKTMAGENPL